MSDTPRTDALRAKHKSGVGNTFYGEMEQLASELERALTAKDARIAELSRMHEERMNELDMQDRALASAEQRIAALQGALEAYVCDDECINTPDAPDFKPGPHVDCRFCAACIALAQTAATSAEGT